MAEKLPKEIVALIQKYISSSLKSVEACITQCPDSAPKYKPLMKTRGELKQILQALKLKEKKMLTKKEQKSFENMFWEVCKKETKNNKEKLEKLADLLFELTGNVDLRMWLHNLKVEGD